MGRDNVRVNLFDIFRFGPGDRGNLGVPKARCAGRAWSEIRYGGRKGATPLQSSMH